MLGPASLVAGGGASRRAQSEEEETAIILPIMRRRGGRALVEVAFIIFLFYTNLLMGVFERSGMGPKRGLMWALSDIFTTANFGIAIVGATIGYIVIEFLRSRL
jgi:hypothetical protein